jgi:uncharacterized membrane protein
MANDASQCPQYPVLGSIRFWLAGPVTILTAVLMMAGMSLWLPEGKAGIDHLIVSLVLFPLIWAILFFYVVLETQPKRLVWVMLSLICGHAVIVALAVMGVFA